VIDSTVITWCHSRVLALPVHHACAALDYLCAGFPTKSTHPNRWAYPTNEFNLTFERRTRTGPPDHMCYAPFRQLHGHHYRRGQWALPVRLELFPWSTARAELHLVPLFHRDVARSSFSRFADAVLDDVAARLVEITRTVDEDSLDRAALWILLCDGLGAFNQRQESLP
jgi:hypothetical protein